MPVQGVAHGSWHQPTEGPGHEHQEQAATEHREQKEVPTHPQEDHQKRHASCWWMKAAQLLAQQDRQRHSQRQHQRTLPK
jgi:hypothetical protein